MNAGIKTLLLALALIFSATNVWALTLQEAKESGLVGENLNGFIATVAANPSNEVYKLVQSINDKRKQQYQAIAAKNKLDIKQVAELAAKKAYEKTKSGYYIESSPGVWTKK